MSWMRTFGLNMVFGWPLRSRIGLPFPSSKGTSAPSAALRQTETQVRLISVSGLPVEPGNT